jgi:hypothetical protein
MKGNPMSKGGLTLRSSLALATLLMFAVAQSADAQNQNRRNRNNNANNNNNNVTTSTAEMGHAYKASELIGASVHTANNEEKGKVKDLMVGPNGRIEYAAVSFGGFLGIGDKLFAVPLDAIHVEWKDNKVNYATVDVSEESIKQRQGFDDNNWPEHADHGFLTTGGNNRAHNRNANTPSGTSTTTVPNTNTNQ